MFEALEPVLRLMARKVFRFCKWAFILVYYSMVLLSGFLLGGRTIIASERLTALGFFGVIFLLAIMALVRDRAREDLGHDDFWGNSLFFRYGQRVHRTVLPIPVQRDWTAEDAAGFAGTLQQALSRRLGQRLAGTSVQVVAKQPITDRGSGETKNFLRLMVRSQHGSRLSHFVHYASFGGTITAHYFTFVRGQYNLLDVGEFVLLSPFTIWFWSLPWLLNLYSLTARMSSFRDSSFDGIDLETMGTMTWNLMGEETRQILADAGLLTDEVKQVLNYHFNEIKVGNVSGSAQVRLENVAQAAGRHVFQGGR